MPTIIELTGREFGLLRVVGLSSRKASNGGAMWTVVCRCGASKDVSGSDLRRGGTTACRRCGNTKHGHAGGGKVSPEYTSWHHMVRRCNDESHDSPVVDLFALVWHTYAIERTEAVLRAVKISLALATAAKLRRLDALRREIRSCTQAYVDSLWTNPGRLDAATLNLVKGGSLSYRHRQGCLKVALETIAATRKAARATGRKPGKPIVRNALRLASLVANIEKGRGSFDYVLKISGLVKGERIVIPFKSHARLNYWLSKPAAELLQGCTLGDGWAALWIELPDLPPKDGPTLAVDTGVNKLLVDSDGVQYGTDLKAKMARVRRSKPGSKGCQRARRARANYINHSVKQLPFASIGTIGVEDLTGIKTGKKKGRSKKFRKALAPWTFRQALTRIAQLAQENRVRLVAVDPRGTSRTCPRCGWESKMNRKGEKFRCQKCDCNADSDFVGARNILVRTLADRQERTVPVALN